MAKPNITASRVREVLDYNPETGALTWRARTSNRIRVGDIAGSVTKNGYLQVALDSGLFYAHRLVWLHVTGEWPAQDIDHINGLRIDNALANLRDVARRVNLQNRRGVRGIKRERSGRWGAQIRAEGTVRHLGTYDTAEAAEAAYIEAKRRLHEGCTV